MNKVAEITAEELETYRQQLTGYCYRMTGSAVEAEDAVQDTMIRAWKSRESFEGRSSLRSWLYRIATNVCLSSLDGKDRKVQPMDFGPSSAAETPVGPKRPELPWIQPIPDALALPPSTDPADAVELKETIRLAFIMALQHLPARQRAVLILCEVLHWKADEVATLLDSTVASVNSALQRARATLDKNRSQAPAVLDVDQQQLLDRYAQSFERYDMKALAELLHQDVVMSMPPFELWLEGPINVEKWLLGQGHGCRGSRLIPVAAYGVGAFGQYRPAADGWEPWALQVVETDGQHIVSLTSFLDTASLFPMFGLPERLEKDGDTNV